MTETATSRCCTLLAELLDSDATKPSDEVAGKLGDFLGCFSGLSETEQNEVRSVLTEPESRKIASFSVVAAQQALVERDEQWLSWSLWAHDVEQFREDPRNNLRLLAVTNYAAEELGIDPRELFKRVASSVSPRTASYLRDFADRSRALRTLQTMGIRAVPDGDRVRFVFD